MESQIPQNFPHHIKVHRFTSKFSQLRRCVRRLTPNPNVPTPGNVQIASALVNPPKPHVPLGSAGAILNVDGGVKVLSFSY